MLTRVNSTRVCCCRWKYYWGFAPRICGGVLYGGEVRVVGPPRDLVRATCSFEHALANSRHHYDGYNTPIPRRRGTQITKAGVIECMTMTTAG